MSNFLFLLSTLLFSFQTVAQDGTLAVQPPAVPQKNRHVEIRLEPHWLLLSELSLDFQIKLSDKFSLGPTLGYMNGEGVFYGSKKSSRIFMTDRTVRETYGLRAVYYFSGFQRKSAFLTLFGKQSKNEVTSTGSPSLFSTTSRHETGSFTENITGITGGYRWVWGRTTLNVGGGLANYNHPKAIEMDSSGDKSEYTLGSPGTSYIIDAGFGIVF